MSEFNLNEEIRCGYKVSSDMKKVWNIELQLLNELTKLCEKYNLKFYADAGTLLGAVRHNGFIPWDDDIDVVMFRDDYENLIKHANELPAPIFLQSWYTEKGYYRGHAQLRNSNTTAILEEEKKFNHKFNQGIFIDIFVLDAIPNDRKELEKERKKIELYNKLINWKFNYNYLDKSFKNKIKRIINSFINLDTVFTKKEKLLKTYKVDQNDYVAPLGFIFETKKRIRTKNLYDEIILFDFENIKIPGPKKYKEYLEKRYGQDYMIPQNMPTSHGDVLLDTQKSYKDYLKKERIRKWEKNIK